MPNTRAGMERREMLARQQAEAERLRAEEVEKKRKARNEERRAKSKRDKAEQVRQAEIARRNRPPSAGPSRHAGPSTSRLTDEDVEMRSETSSAARKGKAKAKGKGKGKAKSALVVIPPGAVKVRLNYFSFLLVLTDLLLAAGGRRAM